MQIVSNGDNLHEMSNSVFRENEKSVTYLSSAELAKTEVKDNTFSLLLICGDWNPYSQQWIRPNSEMEVSIKET